jgi:hypothetical protein
MDLNGAVEWRRGCVGTGRGRGQGRQVAEEEDATSARAGDAFGKVRGVAMDVEDHGAGVVTQSGVGMGCAIVEKLHDSNCCGFPASRMCGGRGAKGNQHGGVNGAHIIEEGANDLLLEPCAHGGEEWGGGVGGCGKLDGGAVRWRNPGVGGGHAVAALVAGRCSNRARVQAM